MILLYFLHFAVSLLFKNLTTLFVFIKTNILNHCNFLMDEEIILVLQWDRLSEILVTNWLKNLIPDDISKLESYQLIANDSKNFETELCNMGMCVCVHVCVFLLPF
jgi:hypothetical protein